jgi:hypothetical protein
MKRDELSNLIENLFSQWQDAKDPDKPFFESQVRKYALQYKEVTGEWYIRDPNKTFINKRECV